MTRRAISSVFWALGATTLAAGCAHTPTEPPEPVVQLVEVKVPQPVPCPALAQLGQEPAYPDTDEAIKAAPNVAERAKLYVKGRTLRVQRLAEYTAAALACQF